MLISPQGLSDALASGDSLVFDCRADLKDPQAGRRAWLEGHVPGAVHADLDRDLAAPIEAHTGRHPLPGVAAFAGFLARSGWRRGLKVVAYDAQGGAFAVRLWWLMRHYAQAEVLLLDGGWLAWQAAGLEVQSGETPIHPSAIPELSDTGNQTLSAAEVQSALAEERLLLLDARDAARFAGEVEPIDAVAGHVPGATNRPFSANLDPSGRFKPAALLADEFGQVLGAVMPQEVVHMCGSGVTACHNLFAMELAGLRGSRLYPGSWSEWIRDPERPVVTGPAQASPQSNS
jgi:thiosulfate/3-mercaptopyruvate sulfurtransferase